MMSNGRNARNAATSGRNEYLDVLDAAWQAHLQAKSDGAPTVISLFAGCGGSSLGYSMAGYRELLAVERDKCAADTFMLNFPEVPIWRDDIERLDGERALGMAGIGPGEIGVLDGSPPCQGFSTIGKRSMEDGRNRLFEEYARLLRVFRPKAFVVENVTGLVKGKMKIIFAEMLGVLEMAGYAISARLVDMSFFGVPQRRCRMIIMGIRNDLSISPSFPQPLRRLPFTAGEALCGIEINDARLFDNRALTKRLILTAKGNALSEYAKRLSPAKPAFTLVTSQDYLRHFDDARRLDPREYARLQSFPDQFRFAGSNRERFGQIGNSVPPLFMRILAQHMRGLICNGR